jgi:endogenous inhibitor of DNA gyrase (YacG/DUF329 family)
MNSQRKCANCGKEAVKEYLPFCSKRCADVDLARWFRGDYSVPVVESDDLPDEYDNDNPPTQH